MNVNVTSPPCAGLRWFLAVAALGAAGCGAGDSVVCPTPVDVCMPCALTGAALAIDISKLDLTKVPELKAYYGVAPPYPLNAAVSIDGSQGMPQLLKIGSEKAVYFSFGSLQGEPRVLSFESNDNTESEVFLSFVDEACEEANPPHEILEGRLVEPQKPEVNSDHAAE